MDDRENGILAAERADWTPYQGPSESFLPTKLTVLIPCYNEAKTIAAVIEGVPKELLQRIGIKVDVLVVDNNSKDNTSPIARSRGARVVFEQRQGKGYAIQTGFRNVSSDTDYVVMIDGDDTYKASEVLRLIEPLRNGFCDVVIGSRLGGKMSERSMSRFNRTGNWFFTFLVRVFYHGNVTDVCTGYFAWKKSVVDNLVDQLTSPGFAIEMEMVTKMARLGYSIYSVPITYDARPNESNLHPVKDGYRISRMAIRNLFWSP